MMSLFKRSIGIFSFSLIIIFVFTGQTNLEAQMKELNRLQAQLEALQTGANQQKEDSSIHLPVDSKKENPTDSSLRYQLVNMEYKNYNPDVNGFTESKGMMKLDTFTGETWIYVMSEYDGYWKKIDNIE